MKIERIELHQIVLPFLNPFQDSSGTKFEHPCILVAIFSDGLVGWGECPAHYDPCYTYETIQTAAHILRDFLVPSVIGREIDSPAEVMALLHRYRGHPMAKAGLECAIWDLLAKAKGVPLSQMLGGVRERVKVGVSVSIKPTIEELLTAIDGYVAQGYGRIKVKIAPGWELEPLKAVRALHPEMMLMADANSAFTLEQVALFQAMDRFNLLMIEQPLDRDDIFEHAQLQAQIKTPICLDESIKSPNDARWAIAIKACKVVNLKVSRVGGLSNTLAIHQLCQDAGIPIWCGGMLESGVGRATNLHLATLPNFTLPGDISATRRYFPEDIAEPYFELNPEDSTITVPTSPGIGVEVNGDRLAKYRQNLEVFTGQSCIK